MRCILFFLFIFFFNTSYALDESGRARIIVDAMALPELALKGSVMRLRADLSDQLAAEEIVSCFEENFSTFNSIFFVNLMMKSLSAVEIKKGYNLAISKAVKSTKEFLLSSYGNPGGQSEYQSKTAYGFYLASINSTAPQQKQSLVDFAKWIEHTSKKYTKTWKDETPEYITEMSLVLSRCLK